MPGLCLNWTDSAVQALGFQLWQFPGSYSFDEMKDHCRNPDNDASPWCYSKVAYEMEAKMEKLNCTNITTCCMYKLYVVRRDVYKYN